MGHSTLRIVLSLPRCFELLLDIMFHPCPLVVLWLIFLS